MNEWFDKIWALRPLGNLVQAKSEFDYVIATNKATGEQVHDKYQQYLTFCRHTERKDQFIKGITNFIRDGDYLGEWSVPGIKETIEKLNKNEAVDPPIVGKPKPYGSHLQRPIVRPNGSNSPKSNGDGKGKGPAGVSIDDQ